MDIGREGGWGAEWRSKWDQTFNLSGRYTFIQHPEDNYMSQGEYFAFNN
jgi:hypothetical protein